MCNLCTSQSMPCKISYHWDHTIAKHSYLLIFQIIGPVPARGVHRLPRKTVDSFDFWPTGHIQLAHSADQEVTGNRVLWVELSIFASFRDLDSRPPFLCIVVPVGFLDCAIKTNVLVQVVLLSNSDEVGEDLFLALKDGMR